MLLRVCSILFCFTLFHSSLFYADVLVNYIREQKPL